jgi:purine-nucleoside phosphorylase
VESIIRVGSAGAYHPDLKLFDIIIGQGACTDSNFAAQYNLPGTFAPIADFGLLRKAVDACEKAGARYMVGNLMSSDVFYNDDPEAWKKWRQMGVLGAEMEAAALYMTAARAGKKALAIDTISDILGTKEEATPEQRQTAFDQMIRVALAVAEE